MLKTSLLIFIFLTFLIGCSKNYKQNQTLMPAIPSNNANKEIEIITDTKNWKHPVKEVFEQNKLKVYKVEITNNTYLTLYVEGIIGNDTTIFSNIAKKNNHRNFTVKDDVCILDVYCDKYHKVFFKWRDE